ncbi:MAG: carboxypeptidase regulatory-like domain-containing protein [Planctomycetales bacterium]
MAGTVTYRGTVPRHPTADSAGIRHELLNVHPRTQGLGEAIVFLNPAQKEPAPESIRKEASPEPSAKGVAAADESKREIVIDQKDYRFVPRVVAVRAGQGVKFTNSDAANHNVRSFAIERANQFNRFTGSGNAYTHRFQLEKKDRPVRIGCDLHPWMGAHIYVFDHPRFAVTDAEGKYRLPQVPPGKYHLTIRQPDGGLRRDQEIEVTDGMQTIDIEFDEKDLRLE